MAALAGRGEALVSSTVKDLAAGAGLTRTSLAGGRAGRDDWGTVSGMKAARAIGPAMGAA